MKYHLITCILERGNADKVINTVLKAGAQAATAYTARGRGVREKMGYSGKFIKEEKEVILIVTKETDTQHIFDIVVEEAQLEDKGKGFAFVQPVEQAIGFID